MDDIAAESASVKRTIRRHRLIVAFKLVYGLAVALVLGWAVVDASQSVEQLEFLASWQSQMMFVLCWVAMAGVLGMAWAQVLRAYMGIRLPLDRWLTIQGMAWAGRYLPGKVGLLAGKMSLVANDTLSLRQLGFSVLFEQVSFVVAGAAIILTTMQWLPWDLFFSSETLIRISRSPLTGVLAVILVAALFFGFSLIAPRIGARARISAVKALALTGLYALAHVFAGVGLYGVLQSISLETPSPSLLYAIALMATASVAGALALFAPAGLGVREVVLAAGLAPWMSVTEALTLAVVLRVLTLAADLLFVLVAIILPRWRKRVPQRQSGPTG